MSADAREPQRSVGELLHELQVHQIELEMQNDELRRAQIELEHSRDRYIDLYDFAPLGYLTLSDNGLIAAVNLTGAALLGVERAALLNRRFAGLLVAEDADRWYRHFLAVLRQDGCRSCEMAFARGDGSRLDARLDCLRICQPGPGAGDAAVVRVALTDIGERKRAEAARLAADAARAANLVEAERLAQLKNDFLANMSHEIRTPLNGVLNLALIGRRDSDAGSKAHATFARIHEAGRHLLAVVNDILDFSKIEAGKLKIEQVAIDPGSFLDRAVEFAAAKAKAKGLAFRLRKAADLPAACLGDPLRLTQILVNLLDNAVKFSGHGGVTLSAGRGADPGGEHLLFEIADTGIGMSEAQLGRLFGAFEQADGSTTRRFGGTGLGLSICKRLVDLMGGEIGVASVVGAGTRFTVRLPLVEVAPPPPQLAAPSPEAGLPLAGIAILAAEDDAINRMVLEELLVTRGAILTCVDNGKLAVERVERDGADAWHIVLMDIQMPVMDGHAAARHLRDHAPGLPIVGLTAHAMETEREKCLASGMLDRVTKPIEPEDLMAAILRHARPSSGGCGRRPA
ncbi:MAG: response regulator [Betaproteobacteria bacterium]|nr:response regulator [Betaproteobacteria bacterium]